MRDMNLCQQCCHKLSEENNRGRYMKNEISFAENLIKIIEDSRNNALKRVNEELIQMYWKIFK